MTDSPTPHELARDLDQMYRQFGAVLDEVKADIGAIRKDTSQILAEQARAQQESRDHERRIARLETDQTQNRRLVVGSLLFPILVMIFGAAMMSGGGL